jgi:membrane-anchored glycerophosphoryl diester phosphodiesterase (GDPDase)
MRSPLLFSRPLTIGDLLDWTFRIYQARFSKFLLTTALFLVPVGLLSGIITGQTLTGYMNIILNAAQNPDMLAEEQFANAMGGGQELLTTLSLLLAPVSFALTGLVSLALTHQALAILRNEEVTIGQSVKAAWQRFWSWVGMSLAMMVVFFGIVIAVTLIITVGGFGIALTAAGLFSALPESGFDPGMAGTTGFVFAVFCFYLVLILAFMAPFVYFTARWSVALPGIVEQRWGAIESLQGSWALTRGHVRRSMIYTVLIYFFYGAFYLALMTLAFALSALVVNAASWASVAIFALLGSVFPVLWQPIHMAAQVMLYHDLRVRNEGYDLQMQIDQLETENRSLAIS